MAGTFSPLEENVAVIADVALNLLITKWQQDTFDPERWPEHRKRKAEDLRNDTPPPPLPSVQPLAVRPAGWTSRTELLFRGPGDQPVVDLSGDAAAEARRAFFDDSDDEPI